MPSHTHEVLIELFRQCPELATTLLQESFGVQLPEFQHAETGSPDVTNVAPTEFRVDNVAVLRGPAGPVLAVVVEVQLARDKRKQRSWPVYLATLRARLDCPAILLVLCPKPAVAAWCAQPIDMGHPDWVLRPLVLDLTHVPVVTDPVQASALPELAVLSAYAHGDHEHRDAIFKAMLTALEADDSGQSDIYYDFVARTLSAAARQHLEALMAIPNYEFGSELILRTRAEGQAEGRAAAVLLVLSARNIEVPPHTRKRILNTTDSNLLTHWITQAATAKTVGDLFE